MLQPNRHQMYLFEICLVALTVEDQKKKKKWRREYLKASSAQQMGLDL